MISPMAVHSNLFSAEQVAELLNLHVKTIRRYLRDGRLKAKRIGKEYRVTRADLEAFAGELRPTEKAVPRTRHVIASSIVDVDAIGPRESERVTTMNPRAREMVASLSPGSWAHSPTSPLPQLTDALAGEVTVQHGAGTIAITAARLAGPEAGVVRVPGGIGGAVAGVGAVVMVEVTEPCRTPRRAAVVRRRPARCGTSAPTARCRARPRARR